MNQKRISHLLIAAGAIATVGILILALLYAPSLARDLSLELNGYDPSSAAPGQISRLGWAGLIGVWTASLVILLALAEYFRVSVRIGKGSTFCPENVASLRRIALYMAIDSVLWILAIFVPGIFGYPVGPAFLLFLMLAIAHFAVALLAWCLGKLLERAVEMQDENDLTV